MPAGVAPITYAKRLFSVQSFQETVWGTPAAATAKWMGLAAYPKFKPKMKSTLYDEARGGLANSYLSNVLELGAEYSIAWQYASYEDINFALMNTLKSVTPTGGNPYTYTYAGPLTSINNLLPYTLEWGYDIMTGQYVGCIGQKLMIKGDARKQWEASISGFCKSFTPNATVAIASSTTATPIAVTTATNHNLNTGDQVVIVGHLVNTNANGTWVITKTSATVFTLNTSVGNGVGAATGTVTKIQTPSLADRTVEAILFPGTTLAIEAAAGTPGTTPFANTFLGFQLEVENNVQPIWTGDSLGPITYAYDKLKPVLTLKLLENQQVKTWLDTTLLAGNRAVVQIKQISGSKSMEIDFAGVLTEDPERYGDTNGGAMVEIKLEGQYDSGALANQLKVIVINTTSTLP